MNDAPAATAVEPFDVVDVIRTKRDGHRLADDQRHAGHHVVAIVQLRIECVEVSKGNIISSRNVGWRVSLLHGIVPLSLNLLMQQRLEVLIPLNALGQIDPVTQFQILNKTNLGAGILCGIRRLNLFNRRLQRINFGCRTVEPFVHIQADRLNDLSA